MSGLYPEKDVILEIATIVTDANLNILAEGPVIAIHQPENVFESMDEWNTRHHNQSGLVDRCRRSQYSLKDAEQETLKFINAARDNYELVGWYQNYDAANNKYSNAFSFDSFEFNDSTVTKPYDRTEPTEYNAPYDTYTSTENKDATNNRIWINHKLELYARWRSRIVGADIRSSQRLVWDSMTPLETPVVPDV